MDGILNINKPTGPTSHDVVARIRRMTRQKRVGHAGTLDPDASGVLMVCLGNATRIIEYLMDWHKGYRASACFGIETDTEDRTGNVLREMDCSHLTREMVEAVLPEFTGSIQQIPPMVSALHHEGKRLYDLARAGQVVERAARPVEVYSLKLLEFESGEKPTAVLDIECSKGTYIRTLCTDIGKAVGCVAHMSSLVRTQVGRFSVEDAVTLDDIQERSESGTLDEILLSLNDALADMPATVLSETDVLRTRQGMFIVSSSLREPLPSLDVPIRILDPAGEMIAIGHLSQEDDGGLVLRPDKVFSGIG